MSDEPQEKESPPVIRFTYRHGAQYRVIKADGAWGNLTPRGDIVMSVFVERPPIPDYEEYLYDAENGIQPRPLKRETKTKGLIREVEVALALRPEVALVMGRWLLAKVKDFETAAGISLDDLAAGVEEIPSIKPVEGET